MLFDLDFGKNIFYHASFSFFLIIYLCFLIPAVIAQTFNPIGKSVIPIGIPRKKQKLKLKYIK